ncbi:MAG: MotA/TolQ/ExbB proton channel family protein [Candidatus Omnitrophica bacterium CG12_big_fil_rev_8_21_14_0_65_50_5]|nr:MAG: MotA/TolQ/ExbB proton channel family protein [Candidatus Omnitrophica bacterium CG12_big_fil_rev_8_21_14_0_65_50_5]
MTNGMWEMKPWALVAAGGPIMIPILICSVLALALVIEKILFFWSIRGDVPFLKHKVFLLVRENRIKEAIHFCEEGKSPVAKILKAGLMKFSSSKEDIREYMEDASFFEIPRLESRLAALATIAHISPLLGLLGTVTGMVTMFHTIQVRSAGMNPISPGDLAGGIWEALITTVAGLMVAIPTFIAYNFFVHKVNRYVQDMEKAATELLHRMNTAVEKGQKASADE